MAERIKIHVGAALTELGEDAPEDYIVHGPNRITALPMEVPVCYQEIAHCLEKSISKVRDSHPECLGEHTSRIVCRYRSQRDLSGRWRCFTSWFGQALDG